MKFLTWLRSLFGKTQIYPGWPGYIPRTPLPPPPEGWSGVALDGQHLPPPVFRSYGHERNRTITLQPEDFEPNSPLVWPTVPAALVPKPPAIRAEQFADTHAQQQDEIKLTMHTAARIIAANNARVDRNYGDGPVTITRGFAPVLTGQELADAKRLLDVDTFTPETQRSSQKEVDHADRCE